MSRRWVDLGAFQAVGALQVLGVQRIGPEVHWCGNDDRAGGRDLVHIDKCNVMPAGIGLWPRWAPNPHHPCPGRVHAMQCRPRSTSGCPISGLSGFAVAYMTPLQAMLVDRSGFLDRTPPRSPSPVLSTAETPGAAFLAAKGRPDDL